MYKVQTLLSLALFGVVILFFDDVRFLYFIIVVCNYSPFSPVSGEVRPLQKPKSRIYSDRYLVKYPTSLCIVIDYSIYLRAQKSKELSLFALICFSIFLSQSVKVRKS